MKRKFITLLILILSKSILAQDAATNTGNLQIHSGGNLIFFGDFTNNGTYTDNAGTLTLDGTAAQTISGSGATNFYNLTINNSSVTGVTFSGGNVTVANVLTLTDGFVYTSSSNLLNLADNATISGGSSASYTIGPMRKTGNDAFTFPIGKVGYYMPIGITAPNTATDVFTAEYFRADPKGVYGTAKDAALSKITDNEYWTLVQNTGSTSENVTLQWNGNTSDIGDLTDLRVASWNGSQWDNLGNSSTTGSTSAGTMLATTATSNYTAFAFGTTTSNNPLPITLLTFTAVLNNKQVDLSWMTATEINNDYFTVEKTKDGKLFEFVAKIKGAGNSNQKLYYSAFDPNPYEGRSYYRLKQTDFNGNNSYSKHVAINISDPKSLSLYPNPSNDGNVVLIIKNNEDPLVIIELADINGKVIQRQEYEFLKDQFLELSFNNLGKGIYIIRIAGESGVTTKKLIIN